MTFTRDEILAQLDERADPWFDFPMLDNGYVYLIDTRLHVYADAERWALLIEIGGFNPRAGGPNGATCAIHRFGNCIGEPGLRNADFVYVIDDDPDSEPLLDDLEAINPAATHMLVRGRRTPVPPRSYVTQFVDPQDAESVTIVELLRATVVTERDLMLATEDELAARVPDSLPQLLRLDHWHHPDLAPGEKPSDSETFQQLASVMVTRDINRYAPTRLPNTQWHNWPGGGSL